MIYNFEFFISLIIFNWLNEFKKFLEHIANHLINNMITYNIYQVYDKFHLNLKKNHINSYILEIKIIFEGILEILIYKKNHFLNSILYLYNY